MALAGCSNPYSEFYKPNPQFNTNSKQISEPVRIYSSNNLSRDLEQASREGYVVIGESAFNSGGQGIKERNLRAHALKVGATLILFSSAYTNTVTGSMPLTTPTSSTTYTRSNATANGPYGSANAYGNSVSTTQGSQTTYIPYSVNRSNYNAVYLVKQKFRLGLVFDILDDRLRQEVESNFGLIVKGVVNNSPAFNANVIPGDIVLSIDGQPLTGPETLTKAMDNSVTGEVKLDVYRKGKRLIIPVTLNSM